MKTSRKLIVALTMAAMLLTMLGTGVVSAAPSSTNVAFNDIASSDYATAINYLAATGIVNGYPDGGFHPSANVTRQEFAKIVINFIGQGNLAQQLSANTPAFKDASKIQSWAVGYVNAAVSLGIIKGYPDGTFQPAKEVTQAEAITMLVRAIGNASLADYYGSTWPGNYLAAAAVLGITSNVNVVAALPADRGEIAQMTFDAASAPKYNFTYNADGKVTSATVAKDQSNNVITVDSVIGSSLKSGQSVTAVSGNTLYASGKAYTLADKIILDGFDALSDTVGETVDLVVSGGKVTLIAKVSAAAEKTVSGTLATSTTTLPSFAGTTATSVYGHWFVTDGNGNYFVVFKDGSLVQAASANPTWVYNGGTTTTPSPSWGGLSATVTLNNSGLASKVAVSANEYANPAVVTAVYQQWNDTSGGQISIAYYNTTATPAVTTTANVTIGTSATVTFNGSSMSAKDAFAKIKSDLAAGVYPLVQKAGNSFTISDNQLKGTLSNVKVTSDGTSVTIGSTTVLLASGYASGNAPDSPGTFTTAIPGTGKNVVALLWNGKVQYLFGSTQALAPTAEVNVTGISSASNGGYNITFDYEGTSMTLSYRGSMSAGLSTGYAVITSALDSNNSTVVDAVYNMSEDTQTYTLTSLTTTNGNVTGFTLTGVDDNTQTITNSGVAGYEVYNSNGTYNGKLEYGATYAVYSVTVGTNTYYVFVKQ